jgi:hypothetical protein
MIGCGTKRTRVLGETKLGRWLGVSHKVGTLMSFWVLTQGGKVLSRTMVQRVTNLESQTVDNAESFTKHSTPPLPLNSATLIILSKTRKGRLFQGTGATKTTYDDDFQDEFHKVTPTKHGPSSMETPDS